ncbi:MAG: Ger(x)C family spore germination protein [Oscillospiraceae bacterium]|nr:Ger(x)C family spore germination protein [Oscillospiraceae bacterium]
MTKRIILIIISLAVCFVGVPRVMPNQREMSQLEIVRVMGIDRTASGSVEVTWVRNYSNTEGGGIEPMEEEAGGEEGGAEGAAAEGAAGGDPPSNEDAGNTISRTGPTVARAIAEIRRSMEREVLSSHISYILIGEDAVKYDVLKYMDYLARDSGARLSARIYFVRGSSAKDLLNTLPENFMLADKLSNFGKYSGVSAISRETTLADFFRNIHSESGDMLVPNVQLVAQNGQQSMALGGYAIIADRRFAGFVDIDQAAGYNLIRQNEHAGEIDVRHEESYVSIRVTDFNTRIGFNFDENTLLGITISTDISANVNEAQRNLSRASVEEVERLAKLRFTSQIESVIGLSQRYRSDFLGLGERLRMRHPYRWERLRENWRETLATLPIHVVVNVDLSEIYGGW